MSIWLGVISVFITLMSHFDLGATFDIYHEKFSPTIYTNEVVETKHRNNYYDRYGYLNWSPYEILTDNLFYKNFSSSFYNMTQEGGSYSMPFATTGLRLATSWTQFDVSNISNVYSQSLVVNSLVFVLDEYGLWNGNKYQIWNFYINGDTNNYYVVELDYYVNSTYPNPTYDSLVYNYCARSNSTFAWQFIVPKTQGNYWYEYFINSSDYQSGYDNGYQYGYDEGYTQGVERGEEIASDPASEIYETTYNSGYNAGFQVGRAEGVADASASAGVPALIFTGILNVALLPVDIFLQMFQYEVFGINIAGLISGLLTVCMVIIIIRFLFGGKGGSKDD